MITASSLVLNREKIKSILFDIVALAFIYFVPTISHYLSVPLYLIEPMRLMLVLAMVHTNKRNAYIIALTLPVFSLLISGHPVAIKAAIMTMELVFNVWLFYTLSKKWQNTFAVMLASILLSKIAYYILKFGLISFAVFNSELISTPIYLQLITSVVFSAYLFFLFKRKEVKE
jgi:hypothetical protein